MGLSLGSFQDVVASDSSQEAGILPDLESEPVGFGDSAFPNVFGSFHLFDSQ